DGSYVLAGGQFELMPVKPWLARFDAQGQDLQVIQMDELDGGVLHGVDVAADGSFVVGGQATIDGEARSFLRSYTPEGVDKWSVDMPGSTLGVVAAIGIDPWGEVVSVATEHCMLVNFAYEQCD